LAYWVKRIKLKSGELLTERELPPTDNRFEGVAPVVGDCITVTCRGRTFRARVIWGNWPDRRHDLETVVPLRVEEI
jgi:hypothetical protein